MRKHQNYALLGVRATVLILAALVLGACILNPESGDGSITIDVPVSGSGVGSSSLSGSATITTDTVVRVWMYTPKGNEYRLQPSGTGLPNAPNYRQTTGGGSIAIHNIPAGDGYGMVVAVGKLDKTTSAFVPTDYAYQKSFSVAAGTETQLRLSLVAAEGLTTTLAGKDLNSVLNIASGSASGNYASSDTAVYKANGSELTGLTGTIYSLSVSPVDPSSSGISDETLLVNTTRGISYSADGSTILDLVTGIPDITDSGAFLVESELVVYYQRLGGLGGAVFAPGSIPVSSYDWNDTGTDLEEWIASDESPVWAAAVSDQSVLLSTVIGTFQATEDLFGGTEINIDALIGGDAGDTAGISFFGVAFPGTDRPLRIRHMGYVGINGEDNVVVGTGRGVFYFPEKAIAGVGSDKLVSGVTATPGTAGNYVVDMSVNDGWVAVLTPARLIVGKPESHDTFKERPLRGYTLGNPRDVFVLDDNGTAVVYIAGSEGLSKITF